MALRTPTTPSSSANRDPLFAALTIGISMLFALLLVEGFLRYQQGQIRQSEYMDPGLVRYDAELGWQLQPSWQGTHRHHDFETSYQVDASGFRFDPNLRAGRPTVLVLGDSFTFGLGVAADETFVSRLNEGSLAPGHYLNRAVVGYSTDQEFLLYQQLAAEAVPDQVLLVTYIGNDLFDNLLPFPLQADHSKPYFRLDPEGQLKLENSPVPLLKKTASARNATLTEIVLGDDRPAQSALTGLLGGFAISQRFGVFQDQTRVPDDVFERRFEAAIATYLALIEQFDLSVSQMGGRLTVVLLPGASFVNSPASVSARYQDYLRVRLLGELQMREGVAVVDAALPLRSITRKNETGLYFPNEGHLNATGHQAVAELLTRELSAGI